MATIADQFVDTYCIVDMEDPRRRSFITLGKLIKFKYMIEKPEVYVFQENVVHNKIIEVEGIPSVQTRYRFVKALRQCGDNAPRIIILLNQIFRKDLIKVCFPEIWLIWNNNMAAKQARRDKHDMLVARSTLRKSKTAMEAHRIHLDVQSLTHNHSVRQWAIDMRRNRSM